MPDSYKRNAEGMLWERWAMITAETAHLIRLCKNRHDIRLTVNARALSEAERQKERRRAKK